MVPYGYDKPLEIFGTTFVSDIKPGKKFIKRVEKDLPLDANDISIALKLYNNLNEVVEYSEEFIAFGQNLSFDFLKRIYDMPIDMINMANIEVTCNSWAKLYAYFLTKHNIPCVISKTGIHRSVYFKSDGFLFNADGTSINNEEQDKYNIDDLTRSRLGLRPNGLRALVINDDEVKKVNVYDLGLSLDKVTKVDYVNFEDRTNTIINNLINCKNFEVLNLEGIEDKVVNNFSLINSLLLEEDLNSVSSIAYINNLIKVLFSKEEQKHFVYIYIKEKDKNGNYKYEEVINYGKLRKHKLDYLFGMPDDLDGYNFIFRNGSIEEITKRKARNYIEKSQNMDLNIGSK